MKRAVLLFLAAVLWSFGTALVLAQQPFFFPIPIGISVQSGSIQIDSTNAAINLTCTGTVTSCQTSTAFTAATSNEFLITFASCGTSGSSVTGVTDNGPGLVWTFRASVSDGGPVAGGAAVFWAQAIGAFSAMTTATYSGCSPGNAIVVTFGVQNVVAPPNSWDVNASLPAITTGSGAIIPTTGPISTTRPVTLLLSFLHGQSGNGGPHPAGWTGVPTSSIWSNLGGCCADFSRADYMKVLTTQVSTTATYASNSPLSWGSIGDALDSQ